MAEAAGVTSQQVAEALVATLVLKTEVLTVAVVSVVVVTVATETASDHISRTSLTASIKYKSPAGANLAGLFCFLFWRRPSSVRSSC